MHGKDHNSHCSYLLIETEPKDSKNHRVKLENPYDLLEYLAIDEAKKDKIFWYKKTVELQDLN